jgi:hypothetical protein
MLMHRVRVFIRVQNAGSNPREWAGTNRGEIIIGQCSQYRDLILAIAEIAEIDLRD